MITLICCLLALSSVAFGRATYGSYSSLPLTQNSGVSSMRDLTGLQSQQQPFMAQLTSQSQLPIQSNYGQQNTGLSAGVSSGIQQDISTIPQKSLMSGYGSSYGVPQVPRRSNIMSDQDAVSQASFGGQSRIAPAPRVFVSPQQQLLEQQQLLQQKIQESLVLTEADNICRGQKPETIIPLDNGRRFVVCLDDTKGSELQCPKGLLFHPDTRRCERKLGPFENPCTSQPCLNDGQCVQTDVASYQCQCQPGFDGRHCELDARVCQTQQPCGQGLDIKCQSFRVNAALDHICIFQDGRAYGLNSQQVTPSPCTGTDGPQALAITDKGFIMCDGESMFIESCPGGTVWDDLNKACVWPDMQGIVSLSLASDQSPQPYGQQSTFVQQRPMFSQPAYTSPQQLIQQRPTFEQTRLTSSYTQTPAAPYSSQTFIQQQPKPQPQLFQQRPVFEQSKVISTYNQVPTQPQVQEQPTSNYASQQDQTPQFQLPQQPTSNYASQQDQTPQIQLPQQQYTSNYASQQPMQLPKPQIWQQPMQRQQEIRPVPQQQQHSSPY